MCLFCFSGEKMSAEEMGKGKYGQAYSQYADNSQMYRVTMCRAPCAEPACWCASMICLPCAQVKMRHKALNHINPNSGWSDYSCCQSKFGGCCCIQPGNMGEESCPVPCAILEAFLCCGLATSVNSMLIRDQYSLGLDEDDARLIRCSNCLMCFATILNCIGICFDWDGEEACKSIVNCVADVTFCCVSGCMTAQVYHEIKEREKMTAPQREAMERG